MEFKIDFLRPGRAFPKDTPLYKLKRKLLGFKKKATGQLIRSVGTSVTTLVISLSVLISSIVFFYVAAYLPRERRLEDQTQEVQQMEIILNSLKQEHQQEQSRRDMIKSRIDQLMSIKSEAVPWTDKLKAINRNLVEGIWLTSLEVKQKTLKSEQGADKGHKKRRRRGKKGEEKPKGEGFPSQMAVIINGATYAFLESKPLKLIAKFMTDLMNDPVWERHFDLTDWVITTSGKEGEAEDLKTVSFRLEMERKR